MATPNFKHALFCAMVTLIIAYPILGLNLVAQGTKVGLEGATTSTVISVVLAAFVVFFFQLFRDSIMGNLGKLPKLNPLSGREPMPQAKRAKLESWVLTAIVVFALFWPFLGSRGSVALAPWVRFSVMLALGLTEGFGLAALWARGSVAFKPVGAYT